MTFVLLMVMGLVCASGVMFVYAADTIITVDNVDAGFSSARGEPPTAWTTSTAPTIRYGASTAQQDARTTPSANDYAKWTPTITEAGEYYIYMTWQESVNRPSAAPLEIAYDGGVYNHFVNQQIGNGWQLLGKFPLSVGTNNYVKITAENGGIIMADAVRFVKVNTQAPSENIIDNVGHVEFTKSATGWSIISTSDSWGNNKSVIGTVGATNIWARWKPAIAKTGYYNIYMYFVGGATTRPPNTAVAIKGADGISNTTVDQKNNSKVWVLIGRYKLSAGVDNYVEISAATVEGATRIEADAVKFVLDEATAEPAPSFDLANNKYNKIVGEVGTEINSLESGEIEFVADITNNTVNILESPKTVTLLVALYNGTQLSDVQFISQPIGLLQTANVKKSIIVPDVGPEALSGYYIKTFLWDDLVKAKPLTTVSPLEPLE